MTPGNDDRPRSHLSVYTDQQGVRVWSVLHKGLPLCAPTTEANARKVWDRHFPGVAAPVWDGDLSRFIP